MILELNYLRGWCILGKRYLLSKREKKNIIRVLSAKYPGIPASKDSRMEVLEDKGLGRIIIIDGVPGLIIIDDKYYPHLRFLLSRGYNWIPYVVVDMGAVKPLLRGADVMRPGIRSINGSFNRGDPVVVVDEKYLKPFVVGEALFDSSVVEGMEKGRVIKNVHRVGDKYWSIV